MPPRRRPQPANDWDELRQTLAEFQQNMQQSMQQAILAALQANNQPPAPPVVPPPDHVQDSEDKEGGADVEENRFALLQTAPPRHRANVATPRQEDNRCWESGFKLDIPEFHGSLQPEEFLDWIGAVEEILEFKEVPDNKRVSLVATRF